MFGNRSSANSIFQLIGSSYEEDHRFYFSGLRGDRADSCAVGEETFPGSQGCLDGHRDSGDDRGYL